MGIGKDVIAKVISKMSDMKQSLAEKSDECLDCLNTILIIRNTISPIARKYMDSLDPFHVEPFFQGELLVNITKHEMVPRHCVLSQDEKEDLLKKYRCKEGQLPKIQSQDPVARYFGVKRG